MKGKFIPEIPGENESYPGKKYPDPDRPKIKFPNLTRPENILKNVPRPRTGFGPVRGNSGFQVAPQVFNIQVVLEKNYTIWFKGVLHLLPKISMFCALSQNDQQFFLKNKSSIL